MGGSSEIGHGAKSDVAAVADIAADADHEEAARTKLFDQSDAFGFEREEAASGGVRVRGLSGAFAQTVVQRDVQREKWIELGLRNHGQSVMVVVCRERECYQFCK